MSKTSALLSRKMRARTEVTHLWTVSRIYSRLSKRWTRSSTNRQSAIISGWIHSKSSRISMMRWEAPTLAQQLTMKAFQTSLALRHHLWGKCSKKHLLMPKLVSYLIGQYPTALNQSKTMREAYTLLGQLRDSMETLRHKEYHATHSRKRQPIVVNRMVYLVRNWIPTLL